MFASSRRASTNSVQRSSSRISSFEVNLTLDDKIRIERKFKQLDGLERDNCQDDPHANLVRNKAAPKFDDELTNGISSSAPKKMRKTNDDKGNISVHAEKSRKRRLVRPEFNKQRFRKSFADHIAEQNRTIAESAVPDYRRINAYHLATAPPPRQPARKFCAVCGKISCYNCIKCGSKYCSLSCRDVHNDTRCMKWVL